MACPWAEYGDISHKLYLLDKLMRFFVSNRVSKAPMLSTSAINVASRRTCLPPSGPFRSAKLSSCRQRVSPSKVCFINESPSPSGSILGDRILTSLFDMQAYVETSVTFAVTQQAIAFGRFIKMDHSLTHPCMISSCIPSLEVLRHQSCHFWVNSLTRFGFT